MIDKPDASSLTETIQPPEPTVIIKRSKGAGFAIFIAFIALFFTAAGIAAGYKHWQRIHDKTKANAVVIAQLSAQITAKTDESETAALSRLVTEATAELDDLTASSLAEIRRLHQESRLFADSVTAQVEALTQQQALLQPTTQTIQAEQWQLRSVGLLLESAQRELQLSAVRYAASSARAALMEAESRLSQLGSRRYLPLRQQIARDIVKLDQFSPPDIGYISQQITALGRSLQPIPLMTAASTEAPPLPSNEAEQTPFWQQYKQQLAAVWQDTVVVTQLDEPVTALLDTQSRQRLLQLLQLRLENLRLLALQGETVAFREQTGLIRTLITDYYPANIAKPWLEQLDRLAALELNPERPDLSQSLALYQQLFKHPATERITEEAQP